MQTRRVPGGRGQLAVGGQLLKKVDEIKMSGEPFRTGTVQGLEPQ